MWCKNTQYRTSPTQVLIEYRWNRNKLSSISISILSFLSFLVGYVICSPFLMSLSSCSLSNVKLSQPPVDIKFFPPLPTIFFFPSTHTLSVQPLFIIWVEISHLLFFEWIQRFKPTHTDAFESTHAHTSVWVLVHKNHRPDSKFTCCSNCFFCRRTGLSRIFWSAQHCAQKNLLTENERILHSLLACWFSAEIYEMVLLLFSEQR